MKHKKAPIKNKMAAKPHHANSKKNQPLFYFLVIVVAGIIAYANSFDGAFVFDDRPNILNNAHLINFSFSDPFFSWNNSRLIGFLTLALNYRLNGLEVWGYHFFNLLIHLTNACLVFWFCRTIFSTPVMTNQAITDKKNQLAFFAALLFVIHPLATESVTYIIQRLASLATLFYLLTVVLYIKARLENSAIMKRISYVVLMAVSFLLAIHTKENTYTIPFAILLVEICFFQTPSFKISLRDKRLYMVLLAIAGTAVLVIYKFTFNVLKPIPPSFGNAYTVTWKNYLYTQFSVILKYMQLLILPIEQNLDYDYPISHSLTDARTLLSLLLLMAILAAAVYFFKKERLISFGMGWFFLTLSVESSIVPISDVIFEHRTYLPSIGFFMAAISVVFLVFRNRSTYYPYGILALVSFIFMMATYERNKVWKTEQSLYEDIIVKSPNKCRVNSNYGMALYQQGKKEEAITYLSKAISINPDYYDAHLNRGNILCMMGKFSEALPDFSKCVALNPTNAKAFCNLGILNASLGNKEKALEQLSRAIALNGQFSMAYYNRGLVYANNGKLTEAQKDFENALEIEPGYQDAKNMLDKLKAR